MSLLVPINGVNYIIPTTNEVGWGSNLDAFFVAISAGTLQKNGGSFTLSAETDFGSSFGLKSLYYKSRGSNIASTGVLRLNNNSDSISFRNFLNNGDLALMVNSSNQLTFNGSIIPTGSATFVSSITGTANQVIASSSTGAVTLSLPQDIATTSSPTFRNGTFTQAGHTVLTVHSTDGTDTTLTEVLLLRDNGLNGLHLKEFGTGISSTINGRSVAGNAQILSDNTLFLNAAQFNVISFGINNTEVGYFDSTGLNLPSALSVSNGGTGSTSKTAYSVICGGTTSTGAFQNVSGVGASGQVLTSNGASALPTWQNASGTGTVNSGTQFQLAYYATSTNVVSGLTLITAARALVSDSNGLPVAATTTATEIGFVNGVTSAIQTQLNTKALDSNVVHRTGNESITGIKNFTTNITYNNTSPAAPLHIGSLGGTAHLFAILAAIPFSSGASNVHTYSDSSTFTGNSGTSFASFSADSASTGSNNHGHIIAFQANNAHGSSGTLTDIYGFSTDATNNGGTITTRYGYNVNDATGSGAITNQYGLYINHLTKGASLNYAIYTVGATPSVFNGQLTAGGTPTNDNAASGFIGEYLEVKNSTFTNTAATGTVAEIDHLILTAGDWDVSASVIYNRNAATFTTTDLEIFISTASGTGTTGIAAPENYVYNVGVAPNNFTSLVLSIPRYRISLASTTTYYLKQLIDHYTAGNPQLTYIFNARRVR